MQNSSRGIQVPYKSELSNLCESLINFIVQTRETINRGRFRVSQVSRDD